MIVPDVNLLLYTYDSTSPFHAKAAEWWETTLRGDEPVGLAYVALFAFLRIGTSSRAFNNPMSPTTAADSIRSWLRQPIVQIIDGGPDHVSKVLSLLENLGTAANLTTDAQLAALAIEHEATLHTSDADFIRFPGLRWFNPLTGRGNRNLKTE
jgi:toxin-antitoxin system PIN domain toxin